MWGIEGGWRPKKKKRPQWLLFWFLMRVGVGHVYRPVDVWCCSFLACGLTSLSLSLSLSNRAGKGNPRWMKPSWHGAVLALALLLVGMTCTAVACAFPVLNSDAECATVLFVAQGCDFRQRTPIDDLDACDAVVYRLKVARAFILIHLSSLALMAVCIAVFQNGVWAGAKYIGGMLGLWASAAQLGAIVAVTSNYNLPFCPNGSLQSNGWTLGVGLYMMVPGFAASLAAAATFLWLNRVAPETTNALCAPRINLH